jgi:hypothetical protein
MIVSLCEKRRNLRSPLPLVLFRRDYPDSYDRKASVKEARSPQEIGETWIIAQNVKLGSNV